MVQGATTISTYKLIPVPDEPMPRRNFDRIELLSCVPPQPLHVHQVKTMTSPAKVGISSRKTEEYVMNLTYKLRNQRTSCSHGRTKYVKADLLDLSSFTHAVKSSTAALKSLNLKFTIPEVIS